MGKIVEHKPVILITAITSRYSEAFEWAIEKSQCLWGPIVLTSQRFDFTETGFYQSTMGDDLKKQFLAFETPFDPAQIADTKIQSNRWESQLAQETELAVERPVNIDPGYLSEAKLVLATTKDRDHRIYLRDGIFAEVTLFYRRNRWTASRWTYPDYQRPDFQEFFSQCRQYLRTKIQEYNRQRDASL
jgi:hypothetical protein